VPQQWKLEYPFLAFKTYTPMNREIAVYHLAQYMPLMRINLGEWTFVCFVNHTQMVEQKLYKYQDEINCDIMMLVKRENKVRLMSLKTNPWLEFDFTTEERYLRKRNIYARQMFVFSGCLDLTKDTKMEFDGDAIQNC
jgi:hypothetical protein